MRLPPAVLALAGLIAGVLAIQAAGRALIETPDDVTASTGITLDAEMEQLALDAAEPAAAGSALDADNAQTPDDAQTLDPGQPETQAVPTEKADRPRLNAPQHEPASETAASQPLDIESSSLQAPAKLERIAPRPPLSEIAIAQPPKPKPVPKPEDWRPTRLFNPVAPAAGLLEAKGYRVALAGIEPTAVGEDCTFDGRTWPCGAQARTAFRSWLRRRAVQCVVPPEPDRELITAECRAGKDDLSAWLVASGWARPANGGAYAEMFEKAKSAKIGLFGPPPKRPELIALPRPAPLDAPATAPAPFEPSPPLPAVPIPAGPPAAGEFPTPPAAP